VTGVSIPEGPIPENPTGHTVWDEQEAGPSHFYFGLFLECAGRLQRKRLAAV